MDNCKIETCFASTEAADASPAKYFTAVEALRMSALVSPNILTVIDISVGYHRGIGTGAGVGTAIGKGVGCVGEGDGFLVGEAEGGGVGTGVGGSEGAAVVGRVGSGVGTGVGATVGTAMQPDDPAWLSCPGIHLPSHRLEVLPPTPYRPAGQGPVHAGEDAPGTLYLPLGQRCVHPLEGDPPVPYLPAGHGPEQDAFVEAPSPNRPGLHSMHSGTSRPLYFPLAQSSQFCPLKRQNCPAGQPTLTGAAMGVGLLVGINASAA